LSASMWALDESCGDGLIISAIVTIIFAMEPQDGGYARLEFASLS